MVSPNSRGHGIEPSTQIVVDQPFEEQHFPVAYWAQRRALARKLYANGSAMSSVRASSASKTPARGKSGITRRLWYRRGQPHRSIPSALKGSKSTDLAELEVM